MRNFLDSFRLKNETEDFQIIIQTIDKGVIFKGTNLWILVFAIFIASLGLNVNSTAVIIGAMLVSPLMGPIMGLGLAMAINDLPLLRKSVLNYLFAAVVGLATSTVYFTLSPLNEAHSEILARTSPNIYDVLIALFGGLAGILATSSKQKGNVIPGVAIATALMPPLCTAGYGLATLNFSFFVGAFYLFLINTVFIALATLITARVLKFPLTHLPERKDELKSQRIIWGVVLLTLLPSIYFGYHIVNEEKYRQRANRFIDGEAALPNDYLLQKAIDAKEKKITLTYGGQFIDENEIDLLRGKMLKYNLDSTSLQIRQGFAYLQEKKEVRDVNPLAIALDEKERQIRQLKMVSDSLAAQRQLGKDIYEELKAQLPSVQSSILQTGIDYAGETKKIVWISIIRSRERIGENERKRLERWFKVRLNTQDLILRFE